MPHISKHNVLFTHELVHMSALIGSFFKEALLFVIINEPSENNLLTGTEDAQTECAQNIPCHS